jgi:ABC-type transport system substrate-binding protein/DNA-binding SARP family transcriptional activator
VAAETGAGVIDERRFPGRQGRILFAYLVAERGRPVPRDELAEAIWGDTPPATWDTALSVLVSKLRAVLAEHGIDGASALTGAFGCYRLELPPGSWVDVLAAAEAAEAAVTALAAGDLDKAKTASELAASLVGQPFLPGDDGPWVEEKRRELGAIRVHALSVLAESCIRLGDAHEAARWASELVALEPFRESGYRQLMQAHVAAGNRAEALRVYDRCRRLLAEELGTYPSPETEAVYRGLLEQAPAGAVDAATSAEELEADPGTVRARPRRKRVLVVAALAVAAAAAGVAGIFAARGAGTQTSVPPNSVVSFDPSGSIAATVPVGALPVALASAAGSLWVGNFDDRSVTRVDASSGNRVRTISIARAPTALTASGADVWVTDSAGGISTIETRYDLVTPRRRPTEPGPGCCFYAASTPRPTLAAFGSVWSVDPAGYVTRLDLRTARRTGTVDVGNDPSAIAAGAGSLWVTNSSDGTLTRIDPATLLTTTIPVGHDPSSVAVNGAGVWVADAADDRVVRVDPETNAPSIAAPVGDGPTAILAVPGGLWVANGRDGSVMRLDPRTGRVRKTVHVGGTPDALGAAGGTVWAAVAPALEAAPATGGVAHLTIRDDPAPLDPALDSGAAVPYATCANLVTYPDKPAPAGSHIIPEVAEAVPTPTAGGTTYTFTIRPGFRFSPPSNQPVTAATFKSTIERVVDPRLRSRYAPQLSGIAGIVVRGRRLTIRLSRPDGGFLATLAGGAACAVPSGTPTVSGGLDDVPSAGPYYIASYTPREQLVLKRNPNYHGDRPRRLDEIVVAIGVSGSHALAEIETGKADYALGGLPRDAGPTLASRYGPGSRAATRGHQQYFISPANGERYLHMNTSRPLFSKARIRRAVSYAIDRAALVAQGRRFAEVNPFNAGEPTDDYFPSSVAGAVDYHLYPLDGPDLRAAKQLAGHLHGTAIMYTPNLPPWVQEAQVVRRDLAPLGIDVEVKQFPIGDFFARLGRRGEPFDLAVSGYSLSADPGQNLAMFDGTTIHRSGNTNFSYFDDPAFDRRLEAAAKLSGPRRYRAYARLELELERNLVPAAAFATDASRDFFSRRIGCQLYQPYWGIDLAALCLRR